MKSCPELPDFKLNVRENLDTPVSQINENNLTFPLWKQVSIECLSSFTSEKYLKANLLNHYM